MEEKKEKNRSSMMRCKYCNEENDEDAVFCIKCGRELDKHENRGNKRFYILRKIFKILSICICGIEVLFALGACFTPFLEMTYRYSITDRPRTTSIGMLQLIYYLQNYQEPTQSFSERIFNLPFHFLANQFAGIVLLSGICLSLIGCIGSVIYTTIKALKEGKKVQFPNLEKGLILSIGSLLFGLMISGMIFMNCDPRNTYFPVNITFKYGSVILAVIGIGISWLVIHHGIGFILDYIEKGNNKLCMDKFFGFLEFILLFLIIFQVGSSFLTIKSISTDSYFNQLTISVVMLFSMLNHKIFSRESHNESFTLEGDLAVSYFLIVFLFLLILGILIFSIIAFMKRTSKFVENKNNHASMKTGITLFLLAIIFISLMGASTGVFSQTEGVVNYVYNSIYLPRTFIAYIASGPSLLMLYSTSLLAIEMIWAYLTKYFNLQVE